MVDDIDSSAVLRPLPARVRCESCFAVRFISRPN